MPVEADASRALTHVGVRATLRHGPPTGPTVSDLAADDRLRASTVVTYAAHFGALFGSPLRPDIGALWLLQDVAWLTAAAVLGGVPSGGRLLVVPGAALAPTLPRAAPPALELDLDAVRLLGGERSELYAAARTGLSQTLEPLVAVLLPDLSAGPRAAWACVTDMAGAVVWEAAGRSGADPATEVGRLLARVAGADDRLLTGLRLRPSSRLGTIRVRHGCCLVYAVADSPLCDSCPRTP